MSKTVFDQLMEKLDEVILGRRYIIAEIGKLKETVSDIQDTSVGDSLSEITGAVNEMKSFMQEAINSMKNLKNSVNNLSTSVNSLNSTTNTTLNAVNALKEGGVSTSAKSTTAPSTAPTPQPQSSTKSQPTPSSSSTSQSSAPSPAPSEPSPSPSSSPSGSASGGGTEFDTILDAAEAGSTAVEIGNKIDDLRTKLSKENPLDPKLFELSMESGRLKALGDVEINEKNMETLKSKINKWKNQ
ncbi:MAG: hypothetical protein R6U96_11795 [Promethearchaeia archaeon]